MKELKVMMIKRDKMTIQEALTKWTEYVKAQKLSPESEKFAIGHPWAFKASKQFFDKVDLKKEDN